MFGEFMLAMRTAIISHQIIARHALQPAAPLAYAHSLNSKIFDTLNMASSGAFVHWGVIGSGKTTAAKYAGLQLQAEGRTVIMLHGFDFSHKTDMRTRLQLGVGVPKEEQPMSSFFNKPTTIIFDHFDWMLKTAYNSKTLETVRELVQESEETQKFNILFIVDSWELAMQLRENSCKLLCSPSRWSREELTELFSSMPEAIRNTQSNQQKEEQIRICTLSGTPDFVISPRHIEPSHPRRAAILDSEWRKGTKALEQGAQEDEVGRFPDKNGVYHWEDLGKFT